MNVRPSQTAREGIHLTHGEGHPAEGPHPGLGVRSLPWSRVDTLLAGFETLLVVLVYAQTLRFEFVLDDIPLILKNPLVLISWRTIPRFFAEGYFDRIFPDSPANDYRPLLSVWLLVNQRLWGFSPAGWHLTAILLLALVTLGVYALGRRLFQDRRQAAIAGALFALHPVHVECAAWVIGMNESLMAAPLLASFLAYLKVRGAGKYAKLWLALSLVGYALALLAKEEAIALPVLIAGFALVYGPPVEGRRREGSAARLGAALAGSAPYWVITAAYLTVRFAVLHGLTHPATSMPFRAIAMTAPLALWRHLRLLLWPSGLTIFYESQYVTALGVVNFLLPTVALLAGLACLVAWGRHSRDARFAAIWVVVPLLPFLDLRVLPEGDFIHDRFLYLPSIGFALLLAMGVGAAARHGRFRLRPIVVELLAAVTLGSAYGALSFYYSRFWVNNAVLSVHAATLSPGSDFALDGLAHEYAIRGQCATAASIYRTVIARSPRYWLAHYNLGVCEFEMGRPQQALEPLGRAAEIAPGEPAVYVYIGLAQYQLGHLAVAETALRRAIEFRPEATGYHYTLGLILKAEGRTHEALAEFRDELAHHPEDAETARQIVQLLTRPPRARQRSPQNKSGKGIP